MSQHKRERKRPSAPGMTAGIDADVSTQIAELQSAVESLGQQVSAIKIPESEEGSEYDDRGVKLSVKKGNQALSLLDSRVKKLELLFPVHRYAYISSVAETCLVCNWYYPDRVSPLGPLVPYIGFAPGNTGDSYSTGQVLTVVKMLYGDTNPDGGLITWVDNSGGGGGGGGFYTADLKAHLPRDIEVGSRGFTTSNNREYVWTGIPKNRTSAKFGWLCLSHTEKIMDGEV